MALPAVTRIVPRPQVSDVLRIPVPGANKVELRYAAITDRDHFGKKWQMVVLKPDAQSRGYCQINLSTLDVSDGTYEYDFIVDGDSAHPVTDPFAHDLAKFGGYRSVF